MGTEWEIVPALDGVAAGKMVQIKDKSSGRFIALTYDQTRCCSYGKKDECEEIAAKIVEEHNDLINLIRELKRTRKIVGHNFEYAIIDELISKYGEEL